MDGLIVVLLIDFECCGLFDEMFVICGGEFGWIFVVEIFIGLKMFNVGCDYNYYGFFIWLVGGGVCGGFVYGNMDEFGYCVVEGCVYVYDFYVMLLYLMGFDYIWFIYWYVGRDYCLMDVYGEVVCELL